MSAWLAEGRVAIYIAKEILGVTDEDELEKESNTTPLPEQAHEIVAIVERSGYVLDKKASSYRDAWKKLRDEVLDERTGWGKEQLKERLDKLLIECMEVYL